MEDFIQISRRMKTVNQSEQLPLFKKHTKEWFLNRVGEVVERSYTTLTPSAEKETSIMLNSMVIATEKHAAACYDYHNMKKVNFIETQIKTK